MANHRYFAPFFNNFFSSLEDAKWNVKISFTPSEALRYLTSQQEFISHYVDAKLYSLTPVNVDVSGNITFGKTRKV